MKYTVTVTVRPKDEDNEKLIRTLVVREINAGAWTALGGGSTMQDSSALGAGAATTVSRSPVTQKDVSALVRVKKSLDARRGAVKLHLRYDVYTHGDQPSATDSGTPFAPQWKSVPPDAPAVVIVGDGPAGIFAALTLLEEGLRPIVVEQGAPTGERKRIIADISRRGAVDPHTNYCFGEGGAGTFSDGKLFSRSNKRGNIGRVLEIFVHHGAPQNILADAHPHIGSDKLPAIINAMNRTITGHGGEVLFGTKCTALLTEAGAASGTAFGGAARVTGVSVQDLATGETRTIAARAVILATGHSAPNVYELVAAISPAALQAKTFAAGVRVEHPRGLIDRIQYHGKERGGVLPAAEYRLTAQVDGRGVYSFCMCPGGLVVPSASSPGCIVVNGMSPSSRNARWSNAAIVVEVRPEDVPAEYAKFPGDPLAGLRFRTAIETACQDAARAGAKTAPIATQLPAPIATQFPAPIATQLPAQIAAKLPAQVAPAQRLTDFLAGRLSQTLPQTSYTPGIASARLDEVLPAHIAARLKAGFAVFGSQMKGFVCEDALLIAPETRTSTPVRVLREKDTFESPAIAGLYPAGEGSGYAGGITSSALDGGNVARAVAKTLR